jgi:tetratricopeptide (TPR) repeat protein
MGSELAAGPNTITSDTRAPADVIADIVRQLESVSGIGLIRQELLSAGSASKPIGAVQSGRILMEAGLVDEAEALYRAMTRSFTGHPGGFVGLAQVAMRRKSWPEALSVWDSILKTFTGACNALWLNDRAMVLFELGRRQEAVAVVAGLLRDFPDGPPGHAGLAQLAFRQRLWPEALNRCEEIVMRFGDHFTAPNWQVMRAGALLELGRADEAETIARAIVKRAPTLLSAFLLMLRLLATTGRAEVAWVALNSSPFREIQSPALVAWRLDILIRLKRLDEARALFLRLLGRASQPDALESLFAFVPALYEGRERQRIWTGLLDRAGAIRSHLVPAGSVPFGILNARIHLALRDRDGVVAAMRDLAKYASLGEPGEAIRRVAAVLSDPLYPDHAKPKIFGIGLSRTGTTTLAAALTILGFNTLHWANPLTHEIISDDDLHIFEAFTDTPISARFELLYDLFPNSKFIFTTRPFDSWVRSMSRYWQRNHGVSGFDEARAEMAQPDAFRYGSEFCNINRSLYFDFNNYAEAFDAHERRVRRFFQDKPADRFLELNVLAGDGWPKLCAFLGRDEPLAPFPWENRQPAQPLPD